MVEKRCSHCKQIKPISEFSKDKNKKSGLDFYCKPCKSKKGKAYNLSPKGKATKRRCQQTEKAKVYQKQYKQSIKYKLQQKQYRQIYNILYPERPKAHKAIMLAIRDKGFPRASTFKCTYCPEQAQQYHHPDYSKPLDVQPVCRSCHRNIHKLNNSTTISA